MGLIDRGRRHYNTANMAQPRNALECFGLSDVGLKRPTNQDRFVVADLRKRARLRQGNLEPARGGATGRLHGHLLAVADGMGGMAEGARAADMAVRAMLRAAINGMGWPDSGDAPEIGRALARAARRCRRRLARELPGEGTKAAGTTLTCACVLGGGWTVLHAGDSRCYLLRKGRLRQLTTDHTIAGRLAAEGALSAKDAAASPFAHVLWNSLSSSSSGEFAPELLTGQWQKGDVMLLCSDGLTKHLDDRTIARVLKPATVGAKDKAEALVSQARSAGGSDNITAVVIQAAALEPRRKAD